jgi:SHS2 domain-containing protein
VRPEHTVPITCEAPSDDLLLVDWLNALVTMATRRMLFSAFDVTIADSHLHATAGKPVDRIHTTGGEVKGDLQSFASAV